ncbi:unnamed protein product [Paramecium pentaurelia]|uniref:Uncharacterized protein n=1 Tax=Paramecium pentaurelia TaxID=43138 RepID=A0A8S1V1C0_9CILI|nr:unnamed protein product [Paramecium pentaurelia]
MDQRLLMMFIYWMLGFFNKVRVEDIEVDSPKLQTILFSDDQEFIYIIRNGQIMDMNQCIIY